MAKSTSLKKLKKELSKWYHFDWEQDNIISVQIEPNSFVLAFFLHDPENPEGIIFSCALDYDPFTIAHLCLEASKVGPIILGEGFYVTNDGKILWGEEAYFQMEFEKRHKTQPKVVNNALN